MPELLAKLEWNPEAVAAAIEPSMHATDLAIDFARDGLPFREAYVKAADSALWQGRSADDSLQARTSAGSGVNLGLDALAARLAAFAAG